MFTDFQKYIKKEKLFSPEQKIILAVSGGVDSMVMLHLFQNLDIDFVAAHCNFKLRAVESDSDEIFIRDYCAENGIEVYVKTFDTKEYATAKGVSIEMAARELRYEWFQELLEQLQFDYLATAHHQDDLVETMLINLSRGTGIRGLSGIHPKTGNVIRPLLFSRRVDILNYAAVNQVHFQQDSSNSELIYQRNLIRNKIIPLFEEINPAFRKNMTRTAGILRDTENIYMEKIGDEKQRLIHTNEKYTQINISELLNTKSQASVLFEIIHPYGFNGEQVDEILHALHADSGKSFYSPTHRLVKDREVLIIDAISESIDHRYYIEKDCISIEKPVKLEFEIVKRTNDFQFSREESIAELDFDLLEFPLVLKKWEQGEYFQPLGMSGFKKLSDYFIDEKVSLTEKDHTWILYSSNKVCWIVGKRMDNRFKTTPKTSQVYRLILK